MKFMTYLCAAAALTMFAACSSEEPNKGNEVGDGDAELTLSLKFNGETRATVPAEDGTAEESKISSVAVYLFNGTDATSTCLARQEAVILNEGAGDGAEVQKTVKVQATNDEVRNTQGVVVVVNENVPFAGASVDPVGKTYTELFATANNTDVAVSNKFVMTNSNYDGAANAQAIVPVTTANWTVVGSATATTPLPVYVERIASKVNFTWNPTKTGEGTVEFKGWGLNATNNSYYPVKQLKSFLDEYTTFTNWPGIADKTIWNNEAGHRSYWAVDPNYTTATGLDLSDVATFTNASGASVYCLENTMNYDHQKRNESTCAIIVATYVPTTLDFNANNDQDKATWLVWNNRQYTTNGYLAAVAEANGLTANDVKLVADTEVQYKGEVVGAKSFYVQVSDTYSGADADAKNAALKTATDGKTECFYKGYCYYEVPIKQLADEVAWDQTEAANQPKHLGRYGVVRNHIYNLTVNSVMNAGTPITSNTINNDQNDDLVSYKLDVTINVLKWAVRNQGIDL